MLQPMSAASSNPIQHKNWLHHGDFSSCVSAGAEPFGSYPAERQQALHCHWGQITHVKVIWESAVSESRDQSWRWAHDPSWSPYLSAKKQRFFYQPGSFSFTSLSLYPLVDVPVPKRFCDLPMGLRSTCYFLMPCGRPCPFWECCGEAGVVVPSACLQSHTSITDSTFLSPGRGILRISDHCSDSCFHHPITQAGITAVRACPAQRSAGQVTSPAWNVMCPAPSVLLPARSWPETWHPLTGILGKGRGRDSSSLTEIPYNKLCNPCTSPAKGNGNGVIK